MAGRKCTKCAAIQTGWQRVIPASTAVSTVLSLLIALFSVAGMIAPRLLAMANRASNVTVRVVGTRGSAPSVILVNASNSGRQQALIHSALLDLRPVGLSEVELTIEDRQKTLIGGEKDNFLDLTIDGLDDLTDAKKKEVAERLCTAKATLTLEVEEADFSGNRIIVKRSDPAFATELIRSWVLPRIASKEEPCPRK